MSGVRAGKPIRKSKKLIKIDMPHIKKDVLIAILLKTYDRLLEVWAETKNHTHEDKLRREMERIEKLIRRLEKLP